MAAITNQSFPGFPSMPLKSLCWSVDIDGLFPLRITYISDTDKHNNQSISLTQLWQFSTGHIHIFSMDFPYSTLEQYHYFFKQKTKKTFFSSRQKTLEIEKRTSKAIFSTSAASAVFMPTSNGYTADIKPVDPDKRHAFLKQDVPESLSFMTNQSSSEGPKRTPFAKITTLDIPGADLASKLTAIYMETPSGSYPIFVKLVAAHVDENQFSFFKQSDRRIIRRVGDIRRSGWHSVSYLAPKPLSI